MRQSKGLEAFSLFLSIRSKYEIMDKILGAVLAFLNQDKLSLFVHYIRVHDSNITLYGYYLHTYNMY